ncbi:MAG TPA: ATP synthase F1 subunit delta [Patescibacteria group bacterium]|jgi:F-type H+-transporting ATPase subunit delta|nr:ATP synthase F1 subunit delta [Patescibacteria group bacterium]
MKFNHKQYAQALYEALHDTAPKDQDKVIQNFIEILKQKGDLAEYEKIIAVYEDYDREQRGITEVEVITAQGATKMNKSLIDDLNEIVGKDIEIKQKVDSNLIGGVVIRAGDTLIDGSVKNHLEQLRQNLESNLT